MPIKKGVDVEDSITVEIGTVGGVLQKVVLNGDRTIGRVKEIAGYPANSEVRVNNEPFNNEDEVEDGETLLVVAREEDKPAGAR